MLVFSYFIDLDDLGWILLLMHSGESPEQYESWYTM
jgi:hypothetical protein